MPQNVDSPPAMNTRNKKKNRGKSKEPQNPNSTKRMSNDESQEMAAEHAATSFVTRENNSTNMPSNKFSSSQQNPANAIFDTLKKQTSDLMLKNILKPLLQPPLCWRISALEKQNEVKNAVIKQLQIQVDDLQQFLKRKSLRIDGITEENGEDAKQLVTQLVTQKMQVSLSPENINLSYRVRKKTEN